MIIPMLIHTEFFILSYIRTGYVILKNTNPKIRVSNRIILTIFQEGAGYLLGPHLSLKLSTICHLS
jgi:hypothetical protein